MKKIILLAVAGLLFSPPLFAVTKACKKSVKEHCSSVDKNDQEALYNCLGRHKRDLNDACEADYQSWRNREKKENAYERDHIPECNAEEKRYCRDVKPGNGRLRNCLRLHKHKLSSKCNEQLKKKSLFY